MKIDAFNSKPLTEAVKDLVMVSAVTHTDDNGNVMSVEIKYKPKEALPENLPKPPQTWR
jgi:hypothetical protein